MIKFLKPLHLACVDDETRPNLALISIKNGIATASNGLLIVKCNLNQTSPLISPDSITILNGKHIHMGAWKDMHKCDMLEFDDDHIYCYSNGARKTFDYSDPNGMMHEPDDLLQQIKDAGEAQVRSVSLNGNLLTVLQKVFESPTLHFSFSPGQQAHIIFPEVEGGMFAALAPIRATVNRYMFI